MSLVVTNPQMIVTVLLDLVSLINPVYATCPAPNLNYYVTGNMNPNKC